MNKEGGVMDKNNELLPCPFCGRWAKSYVTKMGADDLDPIEWSVGCCNNLCGAGLHPYFKSQEDAEKTWNNRTTAAQWIPVGERLPEEFKPVCISGKPYDNYGNLQALAFVAGAQWEFLDDSFNWYDFGVLEDEAPKSKGELDEEEAIYITHWMPLPEPPL